MKKISKTIEIVMYSYTDCIKLNNVKVYIRVICNGVLKLVSIVMKLFILSCYSQCCISFITGVYLRSANTLLTAFCSSSKKARIIRDLTQA